MTSSDTLKSAVSARQFIRVSPSKEFHSDVEMDCEAEDCEDNTQLTVMMFGAERTTVTEEGKKGVYFDNATSEYICYRCAEKRAKARRAPPTSKDAGIRTEDSL